MADEFDDECLQHDYSSNSSHLAAESLGFPGVVHPRKEGQLVDGLFTRTASTVDGHGPQASGKAQEEMKEDKEVSKVRLHEVFLIANPRSGSRQAAKFINRYGTD